MCDIDMIKDEDKNKGIIIETVNDTTLFKLDEVNDVFYRVDVELGVSPGSGEQIIYKIYAIKDDTKTASPTINYKTIKYDGEDTNIVWGTHAPTNLTFREAQNIIYRNVYRNVFNADSSISNSEIIHIEFVAVTDDEKDELRNLISTDVTSASKPLTLTKVYYEKYDYMCTGKFVNGIPSDN